LTYRRYSAIIVVADGAKQDKAEAQEQSDGFESVLKKIHGSKQTQDLPKDEPDVKKRKKQEADL